MAPFVLGSNPMIWQSFSLVSMLRVLNLGMPKFATLTIYWLPGVRARDPGRLPADKERNARMEGLSRKMAKFFELRPKPSGWKLCTFRPTDDLARSREHRVRGSLEDHRRPEDGTNPRSRTSSRSSWLWCSSSAWARNCVPPILQTRLEGVLGVLGRSCSRR